MAASGTVIINGATYNMADLPQAAQEQVRNVQVAEAEIVRLQQQLAIAQTARNAYLTALGNAMSPSA